MPFSLDIFYQRNRRIMTWVIFFGLLYLMRGFLGLIFLTFVIAFIAAPLVRWGENLLRLPRRLAIVLVYLLFLAALTSFAGFVAPQVIREANTLVGNLDAMEGKLIDLKNGLVERYPSMGRAVTFYLQGLIEEDRPGEEPSKPREEQRPAPVPSAPRAVPPGPPAVDGAVASTRSVLDDERLIRIFINQQGALIRQHAPDVLKILGKGSVTMLLALLFSFLITMDTARLLSEVRSLRHSRLHDFYEQTAEPIVRVALIVGRAMQAQAVIACVNTVLTLVGLLFLGVPSLAVLTLTVFLCSFIPVLGVFLSTIPIVLVALNAAGFGQVLAVIGLVTLIHLVEAYLLNPLIYGHHLKLNPVLVLIILYVGHHAFGVWGMLLGVPFAHYFIHDVFGVPLWSEKSLPAAPPPQEGGGAAGGDATA